MIKQQEDTLFLQWVADLKQKSITGQFAQDGIADESMFQKAPFQILFLLKESIDGTTSSPRTNLTVWDEREFVKNGGNKKPTWQNVTRWTHLFLWNNTSWLTTVTEEDRKKTLPYISVMNIKKISGASKSADNVLRQSLNRDILFLRKQLQLYKPNLLICCHNTREWINRLLDKKETDWQSPNGCFEKEGFHYLLEKSFWQNHACLVLDCQHPSKRGNKENTSAAKYFEELNTFWQTLRKNGILLQVGIQ